MEERKLESVKMKNNTKQKRCVRYRWEYMRFKFSRFYM